MSKVALRVYNREIETLVEQEHLEEAIAHCQHILKLYPKHLETYRLLGKAYLEAHRHTDAADIFQRVLISAPDDFVSQLGMSLVRDEQKDMDSAIWHMERAFEVNPSNAAVQGELRRLYGRRDGLEPPKIRLTRGALAYMYTKGGQYPQAIAEIKSVLAEDSTRLDMKVLMARAFYQAGQKVEATEICIDLLKDFPFCLDANRILVDILPGTSMAQSVDMYKKRVQALDPYAAQASSIFDLDSVPDNAVVMERLEWEPGSGPQDSFAGSTEQSTEAIPDFLRSSGWGPSTGEFQEGPVDFGADEPATPAPGLAAAEIPDWLKAMAPPGSSEQPAEEQASASGQNVEAEDLDWLAGLGSLPGGGQASQESSPAASDDQPNWLKDLGGPTSTDQPQAAATDSAGDDQPDWMKDLGTAAAAGAAGAAAQEGLDWLKTPNDSPESDTPAAQPAAGDDSDWLKTLAGSQESSPEQPVASASEGNGTPMDDMDWLKNLGGAQNADAPGEDQAGRPASAPTPSQPLPQAKMPKDSSAEDEAIPAMTAAVSGPGTSESEQDDAMKWLESLAEKQGAKPEELITNPTQRTETAPSWVDQVQNPSTPPSAPTSGAGAKDTTSAEKPIGTTQDWLERSAESGVDQSIPAFMEPPTLVQKPKSAMKQDDPDFVPGPLSGLVSGPGTSESEQDDAMKWLESLAQKQGAKAEELITNPDERTDEMPTWAAQTSAQPPAETPPVEPQPTPAEPQAAAPQNAPAAQEEDDMAWLQGLAGETSAAASSNEAASQESDERMPWEQEETPIPSAQELPQAPQASTEPEQSVTQAQPESAGDVSEWLKNLDVEDQAQPAPPSSQAAGEGLPDWLKSTPEDSASDADLPNWLKDQSADEQPAAPGPAPTWVSDSQTTPPASEPAPAETPQLIFSPPLETPPPPPEQPVSFEAPPADSAPPTPILASTPTPTTPVQPPTPVKPTVRQTGMLGDKDGPTLQNAREMMAHGSMESGINDYLKLIKRGKFLEEVIYDLKEATYAHPVDVIIWQTLGDAHMRANQLQEALDAYTKAEELLR